MTLVSIWSSVWKLCLCVVFRRTLVSSPYLQTGVTRRRQRPHCHCCCPLRPLAGVSRRVSLKNRDSKLQKLNKVMYNLCHFQHHFPFSLSPLFSFPKKLKLWFGELEIKCRADSAIIYRVGQDHRKLILRIPPPYVPICCYSPWEKGSELLNWGRWCSCADLLKETRYFLLDTINLLSMVLSDPVCYIPCLKNQECQARQWPCDTKQITKSRASPAIA